MNSDQPDDTAKKIQDASRRAVDVLDTALKVLLGLGILIIGYEFLHRKG